MLMLHRSSSTDDVIVDRPNDEKVVEIGLMIIYYITNCTNILLFVYYELRFRV